MHEPDYFIYMLSVVKGGVNVKRKRRRGEGVNVKRKTRRLKERG